MCKIYLCWGDIKECKDHPKQKSGKLAIANPSLLELVLDFCLYSYLSIDFHIGTSNNFFLNMKFKAKLNVRKRKTCSSNVVRHNRPTSLYLTNTRKLLPLQLKCSGSNISISKRTHKPIENSIINLSRLNLSCLA